MDILGTIRDLFPQLNLGWIEVMFFVFGLMTSPKKLAEWIVVTIKRLVPPPFKKVLLNFLNQLSKGIDEQIPDELKEN